MPPVNTPLNLLKEISRELRLTMPKNTSLRQNASMKYILGEFRRNQVTEERICREEQEMQHIGDSYLCYLRSTRKYQTLYEQYHRAERSVEDSAHLVGLEVPDKIQHDRHKE